MEIETIKNNSGVKWEMVKLGDYVERIKTWNPTIESPNEYFFYIDLSSVDKDEKIINPKLVLKLLGKDAPSRARQILKKNDVLVSTVRPNLNGVAILNQDYEKATASTGYCILRTKQDLNPLFLYYWVQNEDFVNDMILKSSGASYPAVSDKIIKDSLIPLPPLPVQKRIAEILDAADALRRKDQELLKKYDELAQAIFIDMFGDPVKNEKGWEVKTIGDCTINLNNTRRPVKAEERELMQGIYPYYGATGIIDYVNDYLIDGEFVLISEDGKNLVGRYKKIAFIASGKIWVNNHAHILQGKENCNNLFLEFYLNKIDLSPYITGIDQFKLNRNNLDVVPIVLPPSGLQNEFAEKIKIVEGQKGIVKKKIEIADSLFQTLLQKAFKGELVAE